jgi:hypothetical protein
MPIVEINRNHYGGTTHDQGAIFASWRKQWAELGINKTDASLDCDRLIARRLGVRVKDYWRQTGKVK